MLGLLQQFRWIDALDILIVACAIYQVILALRGSRAFHMILGLAILYLASWVSLRVGLITVNWALSNLLAVWLLLLIILFQPELRRALASMGGRGSLLRAFSRYQEAHVIDEVVRAVTNLAAKKVGAIIVLERNSRLSDVVDSGTTVDAAVSRRLLESIFYPYSPLHDGAVIVSGDRIAAAGCFLPLSVSTSLPRDLGTRHRAAVGLTEETDALALVVSEETGGISLVAGGEISRHLGGADLRQELSVLLRPSAQPLRRQAKPSKVAPAREPQK